MSIALPASTMIFSTPAHADWAGSGAGGDISYFLGEAQDISYGPGPVGVDGSEGGMIMRGSVETVDVGTIQQGFLCGSDIHDTSCTISRVNLGVGFRV